ncbi:hypothetical protein MRX96_007618 [Rhipicephalus microplus]
MAPPQNRKRFTRLRREDGEQDQHKQGNWRLQDELCRFSGLERATVVNANIKDLIHERTMINLSLLALSNCIHSLFKSGAQRVPYEDLKLTHILKDSLGGK